MYLLPDCLNSLKYRAFWEKTDQPSLKKFLDFRFSAGDIEETRVEYTRYNNELNIISRYYAEASEFGQQILKWKNAFKESKRSSTIKCFWKFVAERQNIEVKKKLQDEEAKMKVQELQMTQHITIASVTTEQIQQYAESTTASIAKRFLNADNENTTKRIRIHKDSKEDNSNDGTKDDSFLVSCESLSPVSSKDHSENNNSLISDETSSNTDKDAIDGFFSGPFIEVSHNLIMPCILKCGENFTDVWNRYLLKIDLHQWSVEHDLIVKTFQNNMLKSLCSKECWKQIRGSQLHLAEENLLERLNPVFQKVENDNRSLFQKYAQVWTAIGEGDITLFEQYSLLIIHIFISEFTSKRNIISHPTTTEAMWSTLMCFITGHALRNGNIEYTWGEIVLSSTATRKDNGQDILSLPKLATGHKGDGTGLSSDGRECFVLEISYAPQDQDRRKSAEDLYKLLREMRDMLHISKKEKRELGYKIPKEGLCVYGSQCYGYTLDLFEMEYIKPFYIVRKIGSVNISNNDITKLSFVLRMMWAFKERVVSANEVWNNLKSRYEIDSTLESSDDGDDFTKVTPKKQSKYT
ncbi:hypothetical protein Glove_42g52 [Diversispora epigaea]|uniref:Uncharacterized protein n=1 Tax=Diversispora epigaea TaxID=1348612 RepID=A0A397JEZ3_9GLOM|nr:hypothetical protein Glove_42g52 [Diversispora epigaea]